MSDGSASTKNDKAYANAALVGYDWAQKSASTAQAQRLIHWFTDRPVDENDPLDTQLGDFYYIVNPHLEIDLPLEEYFQYYELDEEGGGADRCIVETVTVESVMKNNEICEHCFRGFIAGALYGAKRTDKIPLTLIEKELLVIPDDPDSECDW